MNFAMNHTDMARASNSVGDAAGEARTANGATALDALIGGLQGSTTAELAVEMKSDWTTGVRGWSDEVSDFAADVAATSKSTDSADDANATFLNPFTMFGSS